MKKNNWKNSNSIDIKKYQFDTNHKVYCDCDEGHHGVVFYGTPKDRLICNNCGHWIYKDEKTKLKYKLKEKGVSVND